MRSVTYTINLTGYLFIGLALAVLLGAFGGTQFECGIGSLGVLAVADTCPLTIQGNSALLRFAVWATMPVALVTIAAALATMIGGLS